MPNDKYITIATDASLSNEHKVASWACYIRTPKRTVRHAALFADYPPRGSTCFAETVALANALAIIDKAVHLPHYKIVVYNEIPHVLTPTTTKAGNIRVRDQARAAVITMHMLPILEKAKSYELRDVKAHTLKHQEAGAPKKYFMNKWCDVSCRRVLREQVARLKARENWHRELNGVQ